MTLFIRSEKPESKISGACTAGTAMPPSEPVKAKKAEEQVKEASYKLYKTSM
jgi:hypothetical protein